MGHLHTQNPSRNQMPYFSASFRPVVFQATGKMQITRTPIQEGQVLEPGNLHFNKQTRKFWCRCSGDHAWRNPRFRRSTLLRSEAVDQMNSQVSSSLMIPTFPPCLSDAHLSYLRWLLWYPATVIFPLTFPTNSMPFLCLWLVCLETRSPIELS